MIIVNVGCSLIPEAEPELTKDAARRSLAAFINHVNKTS
jgi:hypothetical protein